MGCGGLCTAFPWHHCWWGLKGLWTKSSLRLLFLAPSHIHTHSQSCHTGMTSLSHNIPGFTLLPPSPSKSLPLRLFNTLSALTPHTATPMSGPYCLRLRGFQQRDELTAADMRSAASWLQLAASHWLQQWVSILHPVQCTHNQYWSTDYGRGHWHVSGWSQVWASVVCSPHQLMSH